MFRSGTSCLSNILSELGYYFGSETEFFPKDEHNQGGYFELKTLMSINKRLLAALGMAYYRNDPVPADWREIPKIPPFVDQITQYISTSFEGREMWGCKEPQVSALMPFYHEVFSRLEVQPVYAIAARFPLDVAKSQRTHGPLPMLGERVVGIWIHYTLSALRDTKGCKRAVVKYEDVLRDPRSAVAPLIGLTECKPSEEQWQKACSCVQPDWSHSSEKEAALDAWPAIVSQVETLLKKLSRDAQGLNDGVYDSEIEQLWQTWRRINHLIKAESTPHGRTIARCKTDSGELVVEEAYIPSKGWDTVSLVLPLRSPTRVGLDLYQTPCYVYVRRAEWVIGKTRLPVHFTTTECGRIGTFDDLQRIAVLGPVPVETSTPFASEDIRLEMEILVQAEPWVSDEIISLLRTESARLHALTSQRLR